MLQFVMEPMCGGEAHDTAALTSLHAALKSLPAKLDKRKYAFSFLAYVGKDPAGLVNCFEGFSTFAAEPLVNVQDCYVLAPYRRLGVAKILLKVTCLTPLAHRLPWFTI